MKDGFFFRFVVRGVCLFFVFVDFCDDITVKITFLPPRRTSLGVRKLAGQHGYRKEDCVETLCFLLILWILHERLVFIGLYDMWVLLIFCVS